MSLQVGGTAKSFDTPEEHVTRGGVEIDVVTIGEMKVRRATYPPGWRFSTHMGAARCEETHVGYALSGRMGAELSDGTKLEIGPGSVFVIPPGHDGWVVGDEPCTIVQFDDGESAARRFDVATATAKAA